MSSSRHDAPRHLKSPLLSPYSATSETEEESRDGQYFVLLTRKRFLEKLFHLFEFFHSQSHVCYE